MSHVERDDKTDFLSNEALMSFSLTSPVFQEYPYGNESLYRDCVAKVMNEEHEEAMKTIRLVFGPHRTELTLIHSEAA